MAYVQNGEYSSFGPEKTEQTNDLPQSWSQSGLSMFQGPQSALPTMMGTEIKGMPPVHPHGLQLKDDMYFVGGNGSCAMVWGSVIVSGQVNRQCACQATALIPTINLRVGGPVREPRR
ncbi:hypothetical protein SCLCIDRAFT_1216519 [Scleroderma citrinum Foug A]|uniref:Uncharacterized protein n=1 Tax=Scleroderma citrinum Foug A TaxID=1036808 RepID=A0A0C3A7H4_9AGAM|nr:hypothetical protein SCLCIDRAFT_1216519 [Scleroderma citrinum Foug A]